MRFLVDAQLPPALARTLLSLGHDADHVFDLNLARASDRDLWDRAAATSAVVVTKDEDFAVRVQLGHSGPAVIWIRLGNVGNAQLLERCVAVWPAAVLALHRGDRLVEIF